MKLCRYAVAILLALTMPASAEDTRSANFYLPGCKGWLDREKNVLAPDEALEQGLCAGFVIGLGYGVGGRDFCKPEGVTNNQAVAVVVKYIEARPERMHEDFGVLAYEALTAAWPCKR
jgi:Ssp1 endopeptidase immunity protein Rap1a